jgi:hypothetical protein
LKHNPEIVALLEEWKAREPDAFAALEPVIDEHGDLEPLQEIRTTTSVNIEEAVWRLTTNREGESRPRIPNFNIYRNKYGRISKSFWHRSHQMEILSEWQFMRLRNDEPGVPVAFELIGEYYWRKLTTETKELDVKFPIHTRKLMFEDSKWAQVEAFEGPFRFLEMARSIARVLAEAGEDLDDALRYRLISDINA